MESKLFDTVKGNILEVESGVIVHGCNYHGVMGSGVAKAIRARYEEAYKEYNDYYNKYGLELGDVIMKRVSKPLWIANAVTQEDYGSTGQRFVSYDAIDMCFRSIYKKFPSSRVYFPLIGCGLGGGKWSVVENIIYEAALESGFRGKNTLYVL